MKLDRILSVLVVGVLVAAAVVVGVKKARAPGGGGQGLPPAGRRVSLLVVCVEGMDESIAERLMNAGRLPNLAALAENGAVGTFTTLGKDVDPRISWTSLVTGMRPENQGIGGKKISRRGDLVDAPLVPKSRTVGTLWTALSDAGTPVGVLGWYGTWPVEHVNGAMVCPYVSYMLEREHEGDPATLVYPVDLVRVIDPLILDRWAYRRKDLARFVVTDSRIGLEALIGKGYEDLATAVAADHSMVAAARAVVARPGVRALFVGLTGTEVVSQRFWHYAHPDEIRWEDVTEQSRQLLEDQVEALGQAIDRYYEFLDEEIGFLLDVAGEDAVVAVISDHGYEGLSYNAQGHPQLGYHLHSDRGFWILAGPTVVSGARVDGRSLLDVAPTVAAAAGLELGHEPDGTVITEFLRQE